MFSIGFFSLLVTVSPADCNVTSPDAMSTVTLMCRPSPCSARTAVRRLGAVERVPGRSSPSSWRIAGRTSPARRRPALSPKARNPLRILPNSVICMRTLSSTFAGQRSLQLLQGKPSACLRPAGDSRVPIADVGVDELVKSPLSDGPAAAGLPSGIGLTLTSSDSSLIGDALASVSP